MSPPATREASLAGEPGTLHQKGYDNPQPILEGSRCDLCGETTDNPWISWRGESFHHSCLRRTWYLPDPNILERTEKKQRAFGRSAARRVKSRPPDSGDTARLYAHMVKLEEAGRVCWDPIEGDWVERPRLVTPGVISARAVDPFTPKGLLSHFAKVRRVATGWKATCPAHEDRNPSLSIGQGREAFLIKCWAGCSFEEIVRAAGIEPERLWFK